MELNSTIIAITSPNPMTQDTAPVCLEWCANQHIYGMIQSSREMALAVAAAYTLLLAYGMLKDHSRYGKYAPYCLVLAKSFLLVFFILYFWAQRYGFF